MRGATTALKIYFKFIVPNQTGKLVLLVGQVTRNAAKTANQSVCFAEIIFKAFGLLHLSYPKRCVLKTSSPTSGLTHHTRTNVGLISFMSR